MQGITDITAVILAGGFGKRLQSVVSDKPKVLAEVSGKPFLSYLLEQVSSAGVQEVVICTGYLADKIQECFGDVYGTIQVDNDRKQFRYSFITLFLFHRFEATYYVV